MAENGSNGAISPRQTAAIAALLSGLTVGLAATAAGVGERTLARWLAEDETFRAALLRAEGEAIDAATRRLVALADDAIDTLSETLGSEGASAAVKVRAAVAILDKLLTLRELRDIETRLADLEAAQDGQPA